MQNRRLTAVGHASYTNTGAELDIGALAEEFFSHSLAPLERSGHVECGADRETRRPGCRGTAER